jgi:hypothetical protein
MTSPATPLRDSRSDQEVPDVPRAPWSEIGDPFIEEWGRPGGKTMPEHMEVLGPSGSGKSRFIAQVLQDRAVRRQAHEVFIATKPADDTIMELGWPIVKDWRGVNQEAQCIFWPRTGATGARRKAYQEAKIRDLLDRLWGPDANTVITFDEIAYVQKLSRELFDIIEMYLREGRSSGITLVMGKQRPQGVTREMHANTVWVVSFKPADRDDAERTAELFGARKLWLPILESLDQDAYEFVILNRRTGAAYISWIDVPLKKLPRSSVARTA